MDRHIEEEHLNKTIEELSENLLALSVLSNEMKNEVKKYRDYVSEQFYDMDVKEIRGNVDDTGNLELMYKEQLKSISTMKKLLDSPYFGKLCLKLDGKSEQEIYIGPAGFWSDKEACMKIHDWRAPVSSLYYDSQIGRISYKVADNDGPTTTYYEYTGDLSEKLQFKIKNQKIEYMADTSDRVADELLLQALGGNASQKMKPVVATIQKEQNEIIRDTDSKVLVVDGRAGSGKSVIAMHRLAWLLYNKRKTLNAGNVLILSPNKIFSDYISHIMPELSEETVPEKQWDDIMSEIVFLDIDSESKAKQADAILAANVTRINNIRLKTSIAFFEALKAYIEEIVVNSIQFRDFHYEKMTFPKEELEKYFYRNFVSLPPYERFYNIAYFVYERFLTEGGKNYSEGRGDRVIRQIQNILIHEFAEENIIAIYKDFLSAVDTVYPGAIDMLNDEGEITYEDMQALFYIQVALYGCNTYKDIKHVVIDEMQDYSIFQYAIMKQLFRGNMTILGDCNQIIAEGENVLDVLKLVWPEHTLKTLDKTYRSTKEISDFAARILGESSAHATGRSGEGVTESVYYGESDLVAMLKADIAELKKKGYESIAILCDDEEEAYSTYRLLDDISIRYLSEQNTVFGGTAVMSRFLSKGMEFDAVIVVSAKSLAQVMNDIGERHAYYISCTRALHSLKVYTRS